MNGNNFSSIKNYWNKLAKQSQFCLSVVLASSTLITSNSAAQALQFDFSYAPETSLEQRLGFEMAGKIWSSYLSDNITVEIYVEMTDLLPQNVIGGALPGIKARKHIENVYDQLESDINLSCHQCASDDYVTSDDDLAVDNMNLYHNDQRYRVVADNYEVNYNQYINLTRANSKALGLIHNPNNDLDGYILMSNLTAESVDWSYNFLDNSVPNNTLDFLSVALHEIGHVLGFASGVDDPDWLYELSEAQQEQSTKGQTDINEPQSDSDYNQLAANETYITMLDMFRFSPESTSFANNNNDLSVGGEKYFSIDGGNTNLANFSTGNDASLGGDGYQGSHWKQQSNSLGIMDPTLGIGEKGTISELDLRAFDVIGYDCTSYNSSNGYYSCNTPSLNLANLEEQAKWELVTTMANQYGWSNYHASWIDWYINNGYNNIAASGINQDRTQDVIDMIIASEVYKWNWDTGNNNGNGNCNPNCNGHPQVLANILTNEGLFSQAYWSTLDVESKPVEVPEPGIKIGLLGLGLWASRSLLKHNKSVGN